MSAWKISFAKGVASFRADNIEDALKYFSEAITMEGTEPTIYDSRAAVYEKIDRFKEALLDSKKVIDLAPDLWKGYARASRLFLKLNKHKPALQMVQLALERIAAGDDRRRSELTALRGNIFKGIEDRQKQLSNAFCHFGKLPLEIAIAIFKIALVEDHAQVVLLAQVCRHWRTAIVDTPSLWSILVLSNKNPGKKARIWGVRSQGRLTSLSLRSTFPNDLRVYDELWSLPLDWLRTLRIEQFASEQLQKLMKKHLTGAVWQGLDVLELKHSTTANFIQPDMQLRVLTVTECFLDWKAAADHLTHLEEFVFDGIFHPEAYPHLVWLLHQNPALRKLCLRLISPAAGPGDMTSDRTIPTLIHLPMLTDLQFRVHNHPTSSVIPILVTPSLRTLHFLRGSHSLDPALQTLAENGCAKTLTELRIRQCPVSSHALVQFLRDTVALETLECSNIGDGQANAVLEALAGPITRTSVASSQESKDTTEGPAVLCPSLRHVDFSNCPGIKSGPLVRLVNTRLQSAAVVIDADGGPPETLAVPIDTIIVDGCPAVDAVVLPWLRSNVRVVSCVYMMKQFAKWRR